VGTPDTTPVRLRVVDRTRPRVWLSTPSATTWRCRLRPRSSRDRTTAALSGVSSAVTSGRVMVISWIGRSARAATQAVVRASSSTAIQDALRRVRAIAVAAGTPIR
jgi:hypothetical protein